MTPKRYLIGCWHLLCFVYGFLCGLLIGICRGFRQAYRAERTH